MPYKESAECPKCGAVANGRTQIDKAFGYRYNGTRAQSWCRQCRSNYSSKKKGDEDDLLSIGVNEAAKIWSIKNYDSDYMFGYTEDELRAAISNIMSGLADT